MANNFENMTVGDIFESARYAYQNYSSDPLSRAQGWVEAENIFLIRNIICDWFDALEDGSVEGRTPDPSGPNVSELEAQQMLDAMEEDFLIEKGRYVWEDVDTSPQINTRLTIPQRIAMVQEIKANLLYPDEIKKIAQERLESKMLPKFVLYNDSNAAEYMGDLDPFMG